MNNTTTAMHELDEINILLDEINSRIEDLLNTRSELLEAKGFTRGVLSTKPLMDVVS